MADGPPRQGEVTVLDVPEVTVSARHKGFPFAALGRLATDVSGTLDDFLTPILVLKNAPLRHNLATMARFCAEHALSLAPHVKTTMSPEIASAQLEHGVWALTLATPSQVRTFRELGAQRVVLANELVDPQAIAWLGAELTENADFTCYCYVDSFDGIDVLEKELPPGGYHCRCCWSWASKAAARGCATSACCRHSPNECGVRPCWNW